MAYEMAVASLLRRHLSCPEHDVNCLIPILWRPDQIQSHVGQKQIILSVLETEPSQLSWQASTLATMPLWFHSTLIICICILAWALIKSQENDYKLLLFFQDQSIAQCEHCSTQLLFHKSSCQNVFKCVNFNVNYHKFWRLVMCKQTNLA